MWGWCQNAMHNSLLRWFGFRTIFSTLSEENMYTKYIYYIYNRQNISMYIYQTRIVLKTEYAKNDVHIQCTNLKCAICIVQCTLCNVQCTMYVVQYSSGRGDSSLCWGKRDPRSNCFSENQWLFKHFCFGFLSFVGMNTQSLEGAKAGWAWGWKRSKIVWLLFLFLNLKDHSKKIFLWDRWISQAWFVINHAET